MSRATMRSGAPTFSQETDDEALDIDDRDTVRLLVSRKRAREEEVASSEDESGRGEDWGVDPMDIAACGSTSRS